jgi:hypothetical protein
MHHLGLVLSKIENLSRMDFTAYSLVEVIVRDFSIPIIVEFVEDHLEALNVQVETPMVQVEAELLGGNHPVLRFVQVVEGLADGLPLELYLINDGLLKLSIGKSVHRSGTLIDIRALSLLS